MFQFKRPSGPRNRRAPSWHGQDFNQMKEPLRPNSLGVEPVVDASPSIGFLESHHLKPTVNWSPPDVKSAVIPPLDLSILHEHCCGNGKSINIIVGIGRQPCFGDSKLFEHFSLQ